MHVTKIKAKSEVVFWIRDIIISKIIEHFIELIAKQLNDGNFYFS